MAIKDINGDTYALNVNTHEVDYDQDILSNEISRYYVIGDNDIQITVSK